MLLVSRGIPSMSTQQTLKVSYSLTYIKLSQTKAHCQHSVKFEIRIKMLTPLKQTLSKK